MAFTFTTDISASALDSFVIRSEQNSLFQCSPWEKVKSNWGFLRCGATDNGEVCASALVLVRRMPLGKTLFYIPRGPVMDYGNKELVTCMFEGLRKLAKQRHAIAIRFDPAVLSRRYSYRDRDEEHERQNEDVISLLQSIAAKHKGYTIRIEESTQPRFNAEMDIVPDFEKHLEHKTMKCIRSALHKGIKVYEGPEYVHDFAEAMHYTEVRKQIALRDEQYFKTMLEAYGERGICMVTKLNFPEQIGKLQEAVRSAEEELAGNVSKKKKAELEQNLARDRKELGLLEEDYKREGRDEVITCGILACWNENLMELFYMGNNPDYLRMYSSYLLYKLCLDRCVELGIPKCSFGGIEGTLDDGLTLFKSNWIMNVEEYIGEFNIVLDPLMYTAFDKVYPEMLKFAAKMRGKQ